MPDPVAVTFLGGLGEIGRNCACIEVNGRIASQFAPLVQGLHGRSTYDALFELACGEDPGWESGLPDGVAVSYVIRVFDDAFVEEVPDPEEGLELLVRPGLFLSEQGLVPSFSQGSSFFTSFALVTFHPSVSALSQREIAQYCTVFLSQLAV